MRVPSLRLLFFAWKWALVSAVAVPGAQSVLALSGVSGVATFAWSATWDYEEAWKTILEHKDEAVAYASVALEENKKAFEDVGGKIDQFRDGMNLVVDRAREAKVLFEQYRVDPQEIIDRLNEAGSDAVEHLQNEFEKPLPEDMDERARYRAAMIKSVLDRLEEPYVSASVKVGIPEDKARDSFRSIRSVLEDTLIVAGNIADKHPVLVETVVIGAVFMMLPETLILRPFLRLFGFGPFGPMKGSLAAWLQRRFWGGFVARSSWFAWMQRAGMVRGWWTCLAAILRAIAAFFGL